MKNMKKEISSLNKVASELEKLSKISKVYTPQQQDMFTKINSMFHRLSMNGQKDTTEKLNFKNGDLIMSKVDGKVMIEYKGTLKPFKNQTSLEKFIEDNLDYYMNKIDGKIKRSSSSQKNAISFEDYKKEHPNTKKTQSDPIFQTSSGKSIKNVPKNHKVHDGAMKSLGSKHDDILITHDGKGSGTVHHTNGKSFSYDYDRGANGFFSPHGFHEEFSDMADAALKHLK